MSYADSYLNMYSIPVEVQDSTPKHYTLFAFKDGSIFGVFDTKEPYKLKEEILSAGYHPTGGYQINVWSWSIAIWIYLDNTPDLDTLFSFMKALERRHGQCL